MDQSLTCANCERPWNGQPYICGCLLCPVCIGGITKSCPACHELVPMGRVEGMERREGDLSAVVFVALLLLGAVVWLYVIRGEWMR